MVHVHRERIRMIEAEKQHVAIDRQVSGGGGEEGGVITTDYILGRLLWFRDHMTPMIGWTERERE